MTEDSRRSESGGWRRRTISTVSPFTVLFLVGPQTLPFIFVTLLRVFYCSLVVTRTDGSYLCFGTPALDLPQPLALLPSLSLFQAFLLLFHSINVIRQAQLINWQGWPSSGSPRRSLSTTRSGSSSRCASSLIKTIK